MLDPVARGDDGPPVHERHHQELPGDATRPSPSRHHGHLWTLLDGTPAHAPPGRLTVGDDGRIACHLCGRWFDHLGLHLRRHGWDSDRYREAVGLARRRPLCSRQLSARIAHRQQVRWHRDPHVQHHFAAGQRAARSGDLAALAALVRRTQVAENTVPLEVREQRPRTLARGRQTLAVRRAEHLDEVVRRAGHPSLADYLRVEYASGASLEALGHATGLGRARLSVELDTAGVVRRPTGANTPAGKASRARRHEELAAATVGVEPDQLGTWLAARAAEGVTLTDLAARVGHSIPWVRARLAS